jgi:glycine/D-amino acid oxidase-like deaminating enzyme
VASIFWPLQRAGRLESRSQSRETDGRQARRIRVNRATVVGAGVFGAWIAHALNKRGWQVTLIEQYGPANSRASSGGETRIIRSGYGRLAIYSRWARDAMSDWLALQRRVNETLFVRTGALFIERNREWLQATEDTFRRERIACRWLAAEDLARRLPQLSFVGAAGALFEPDAGVLFARRSVQALVQTLVADGVELITEYGDPRRLMLRNKDDALIFAAGAWLPRLFPAVLQEAIFPTRQEVFFFGPPPGDQRFSPARLPAWVAFEEGIYGLPDLEHRGVKVAIDAHGDEADPERMERVVSTESIARMRAILREHLPALADAPLLEARVCQYENTTNGHLLIDRLPGHDNVWIAGGGSGHGFKHGPMVGRYVADLVEGTIEGEPLFRLAGRPSKARAVF